MEASNYNMPETFSVDDSACDAWKRCTVEVVNLLSKSSKPSLIKDYNCLLLENIDLKKQNKIAMAALDSIISDKENILKKFEGSFKVDESKVKSIIKNGNLLETVALVHAEPCLKISKEPLSIKHDVNFSSPLEVGKVIPNFKTKEKNKAPVLEPPKVSPLKTKATNFQVSQCSNCTKTQVLPISNIDSISTLKPSSDETIFNLKQELAQTYEDNKSLNFELQEQKKENGELRDQIQSLELSVKTLTEAINLQDEQLNEYGTVVSSLRKSRAQIVDKMKEANARNAYNVKIMAKVEEEVELLRRQLDAYNELLDNQHVHRIDKSSSTEHIDDEQRTNLEIMMKKDNYINMLQDRLCEAIVDLKNKDSEIKNHTNSVKALINNYETEKHCLEERLKSANVSAKKLEENRIKQQETMKQLMKLIEFLQEKLEKINKK